MVQIEQLITVGQVVYIVYKDKLLKREVVSLSKEGDKITGSLNWKSGGNGYPTRFYFQEREITGTYEYAYNRSEHFTGFLTLEEATSYARENILKINKQMREDVQKAMDKLKKFREKHHELLWTDENNRWIECFEREYQW